MQSSLSIIKETGKEGANDTGSSQHLIRLFQTLGTLLHGGPPLHPPTIYPAYWFCPPLEAHHSCATPLNESAPSISHARVSLLGARIAQELFDYILAYVEDWRYYGAAQFSKSQIRSSFAYAPASQKNLRPYTLVCRRWANKCRRYIFGSAILEISSLEDMDEFIQYSFHGCPLLLSLHKIIRAIHMIQSYNDSHSFCHRIPSLVLLKVPVHMLELRGPVPNSSFPLHMLKTPHWSIPPTVATPPSLISGCWGVTVDNIHMASFSHAVQLARHLSSVAVSCAGINGSVLYDRLTWHDNCNRHSPVYRKPVLCRRPYIPNHVNIEADACTDNVRLCLYTAIARPTFAMHWMQENERQWIFSLVTSLNQFLQAERVIFQYCKLYSEFCRFEDHQWHHISWRLGNSSYSTNSLEPAVRVAFCLGRILRDTPVPSVRVVGLEVDLTMAHTVGFWGPVFTVVFGALLAKIRSCPTALVINFRFPDLWTYKRLYKDLKQHRPFNWNPQTEAHTIVFTVRSFFGTSEVWERLDPIALDPTGQTWQRHQDIIPSLVSEQSQDDDHVL